MKLSVIIPAYNAQAYLPQAVRSAANQLWNGEKELLVIDDGSEDSTAEIAAALGAVVVRQPRQGAAAARNAGLRVAGGEWIMFLDADDILTPNALSALYAPITAAPSVLAVFSKAVDFISPELTPTQKSTLCPRPQAYGGVLPGCALLHRSVFERVGVFDQTLRTGETVAWQIALRDSGCPAVFIDAVTLQRRLHLNNTGRVQKARELSDYMVIVRGRMNRNK